jgi:hypothetical protein
LVLKQLQFYLDEHIPLEVGYQLRRRNIEVVLPREIEMLSASDMNHLNRAISLSCVLCTYDSDFILLAQQGIGHFGIVKGQARKHHIGDWVHFLELLHTLVSPDQMMNMIEFIRSGLSLGVLIKGHKVSNNRKKTFYDLL